MLSFKFISSAGGAAHYFESSDDYYDKESHRGEWLGKGASALNLGEAVDSEVFKNLLDGQLPDGTKVRTTQTKGSKDRKGIDFTFSAPKSVSIQALVQGDSRITAAHDRAVKESLDFLQEFAAARKKEGGLSFREHTNELVVAAFRHELSRAQDPQLHTHAIVMNLTRRADGTWRSLSNEDMLKNVKVVGAFYRATLAKHLKELGYDLRETRKGGWELAHIPDSAIGHFSQRSKEIERLLQQRGRDRESASTSEKQIVTLATRRKKTASDREWLRDQWRQTAREAGVDLERHLGLAHIAVRKITETASSLKERLTGRSVESDAASAAVNFAIEHLAERQGLFSRAELLEAAYGHAATRTTTSAVNQALDVAQTDGRLVAELALYQTARSLNRSVADIAKDPSTAHFKAHDELERLTRASWISLTMAVRKQSQAEAEKTVDGAIQRGALTRSEQRFTTPEARRSEVRLLAIEKAGRGVVAPIASAERVAAMLAASDLNNGQREAVGMVLTTTSRFSGVQGLAGTGKSHMMSRAVREIRAEAGRLSGTAGYTVIGLAPYASQNRALEALGMQSQTLASFLARQGQQAALNSRSIIFLDEAGVVPAHQLEKLMAIVERQDARLVLSGDRKQTHAVEAGKPFEQLQDAGMTQAFLTEIKRQNDMTIRAAVVHAANDRVPEAGVLLKSRTVQIPVDAKRYERIAKTYTALSVSERNDTIIVAGTNDARREINRLVRQELALPESHRVDILNSVDMTRAESKSAQSYEPGQIVIPHRTYGADMQKGDQLTIVGHDAKRNTLTVVAPDGRQITFDPAKRSMVRVYEKETVDLSPGEWIRITSNNKALGVNNGERYQVQSINAKQVVLDGGAGPIQMDQTRPLHLQYGYASTVHSAQGLTTGRVLIDANTRSLTSNRAVFYVAVSRARDDVTLFTNDAKSLAVAMSRQPKKYAALELRDAVNEGRVLHAKIDRSAQRKLAARLHVSSQPVTRAPTSARTLS